MVVKHSNKKNKKSLPKKKSSSKKKEKSIDQKDFLENIDHFSDIIEEKNLNTIPKKTMNKEMKIDIMYLPHKNKGYFPDIIEEKNFNTIPNKLMNKEMEFDIMYSPHKNNHHHKISPFKMFDLFRTINEKPMNLERMTYEEIKITNKLLREILSLIKK